jgi:hypothetical protein
MTGGTAELGKIRDKFVVCERFILAPAHDRYKRFMT